MKYNYVFYGLDNNYYRCTFSDLKKVEDSVKVLGDPFVSRNKLLNIIYKIHTYPYTNLYINLPYKEVWNRFCDMGSFKDTKPVCFIFTPKLALDDTYIRFLRKKNPNCKIILMFRDLISNEMKFYPHFDISKIRRNFDKLFSYNLYDCKTYNMTYFNLEASRIEVTQNLDCPQYDVIFIGTSKDRMKEIIRAYDIFISAGLNCFFYVVTHEKYVIKVLFLLRG